MTQIAIKQLIADIHIATAKATKSQSAALKFLKEAGILQNLSANKTRTTSKGKVISNKK